ncbi:MAG: TraR/DksA family transcriptional regulator [Acidobacteria bacterium]|nr:TraR/DksA family transcriptional regulator [Acidobacteriota bacterium]
MEEHAAIRQKLTERYAEIQNRLARIVSDVRHANKPLDADFAEQAVERENDEVLAALDSSIRAEMAQIEKTLARLDEGEYGICEVCGNPIAPKRLEVLPHATRCVVCEGKARD